MTNALSFKMIFEILITFYLIISTDLISTGKKNHEVTMFENDSDFQLALDYAKHWSFDVSEALSTISK